MSSRKAGGSSAVLSVGGNAGQGSPTVNQLNKHMNGMGLGPEEDGWEVCARKPRNRTGGGALPKQQESSGSPKVWGNAEGLPRQGWGTNGGAGRMSANNWVQSNESRTSGGGGNARQPPPSNCWGSQYMAPPPTVRPPLQHGWQWGARGASSTSQQKIEEPVPKNTQQDSLVESVADKLPDQHDDDSDDDHDLMNDSDDDLTDDYDSDASQKSHETRKKNKWFRGFFEELDKLTVEEINGTTKDWHCPACYNAPGAIDWYKGLQPLATHAKTKGAARVKLHRELAFLLEEELRSRGTSVVPSGEVFGKWKGLKELTTDHEIVWPPMVIVMNTFLEKDENEKWIGMGNQELLEYFSPYAAVKARHSYGPSGHRGMSVLIFEATVMGYSEAERLDKHFAEQGTSRNAWEYSRRNIFSEGGKRQLYGYLARKEDLDDFNYHCQGKSRLKFDMKSYQEMVVIPMKRMNDDNQQLVILKNKVIKHEERSKALEATFGMVTQKLRETMEENRIVRLRTKKQHEENKEEMDYQEQFFKEQMDKIQKATEEKEKIFEKLLQEERAKAKHSDVNSGNSEEQRLRKAEIASFINKQEKGVEEFESRRDKLIRAHEEKKFELRRKYLESEIELEKEFDAELTKLMDEYSPGSFHASSSSS